MMIRRFSVLTALVAVLFAAGCARNADSDSPAAPPAAAPSDVIGEPSSPPGKAGGQGGQTITGTVTAGVEPNCVLLSGNGTDYLLIFADPALRDQVKTGEEATVVGQAEEGQLTTCQQGTPFRVTAVQPN
jgi:hypothetical protein